MSEYDEFVDELDEEENRETRMPMVNGQPLIGELSEEGAVDEPRSAARPGEDGVDVSASSESSSRGAASSEGEGSLTELASPSEGVGLTEGESIAAAGDAVRPEGHSQTPASPSASARKSSRCSGYAPAGTKCKLCGKVHAQGRGESLHVSVDGDVQTDFKPKKKERT